MVSMNLMDGHLVIIQEIEAGLPQKTIAKTYALALRSQEKTDWKAANEAIIERWSISGLERIKKMAWDGSCFDG